MKFKLEHYLWVALVIMIIIAGTALGAIKTQGAKCISDPLKYGVNQVAKQTGYQITCSCYSNKSNSNPLILQSNLTK